MLRRNQVHLRQMDFCVPGGTEFMHIDQIQCFIAVADQGSFQNAAFELNMAQSTVSKKIMQLEDEMGISLFDRSKRKIALTADGEKMLPYARTLNEDYEKMMAASHSAEGSRLMLGEIYFGSNNPFLELKTAFMADHPEITIECIGGVTDAMVDKVLAGELDAALVSSIYNVDFGTDNFALDARFRSLSLRKSLYYVVVSRSNPLAARKLLSYPDLQGSCFCAPYRSMTVYHTAMLELAERYHLPYRPQYFSSIRETQKAVEHNLGFTIMTEQALEESDQLVRIPMTDHICRDTQLVIRAHKPSLAAKMFFRYAEKYCTEQK